MTSETTTSTMVQKPLINSLTSETQPWCLRNLLKHLPRTGYDPHFGASLSRIDRSGRAPRARRLNLSDVDWYAHEDTLPGRQLYIRQVYIAETRLIDPL